MRLRLLHYFTIAITASALVATPAFSKAKKSTKSSKNSKRNVSSAKSASSKAVVDPQAHAAAVNRILPLPIDDRELLASVISTTNIDATLFPPLNEVEVSESENLVTQLITSTNGEAVALGVSKGSALVLQFGGGPLAFLSTLPMASLIEPERPIQVSAPQLH